MLEVISDDEGGLDEDNTKSVISNIFIYHGALDRCNNTINLYNKSVE